MFELPVRKSLVIDLAKDTRIFKTSKYVKATVWGD